MNKFSHFGTQINRLKQFQNYILCTCFLSSSQLTANTITATIMTIAKKSPRAIALKEYLGFNCCSSFLSFVYPNSAAKCALSSFTAELNSTREHLKSTQNHCQECETHKTSDEEKNALNSRFIMFIPTQKSQFYVRTRKISSLHFIF